MNEKQIKLYAAIAFQFAILITLGVGFFLFPDFREFIGGVLGGLLVGIGIESIKQ